MRVLYKVNSVCIEQSDPAAHKMTLVRASNADSEIAFYFLLQPLDEGDGGLGGGVDESRVEGPAASTPILAKGPAASTPILAKGPATSTPILAKVIALRR